MNCYLCEKKYRETYFGYFCKDCLRIKHFVDVYGTKINNILEKSFDISLEDSTFENIPNTDNKKNEINTNTTEVSKPVNTGVSKPITTDTEVSKPVNTEVSKPVTTEVSKPITIDTEVSKPVNTEVSKPVNTDTEVSKPKRVYNLRYKRP